MSRFIAAMYGASDALAENMGFDAAINGADETNCHFSLFSTPALKDAWERGNERGRKAKQSAALSEGEIK